MAVIEDLTTTCISLSRALLDDLREQARRNEVSVSQLARVYMRRGLAEHQAEQIRHQEPARAASR